MDTDFNGRGDTKRTIHEFTSNAARLLDCFGKAPEIFPLGES